MVCDRCRRLISCRQFRDDASIDPGLCPTCGRELTPWQGRTWHEQHADGSMGAERVEGPCPACGTTIDNRHDGEQLVSVTLWD
jgi:ssDNA-binding Zn-finger/Zn-ribbon topoisomerase 1